MRARALALFQISLLVASAFAVNADAQVPRRIAPATQPSAPANPGITSTPNSFALPNPSGLSSAFPAGLPNSATSAAGLPSSAVPGIASTGGVAGTVSQDAGLPVQTNVMGAAAAGGGVGIPRMSAGVGSVGSVGSVGRWSAVDLARSFIEADANRDGDLTRAEAMRLSIAPLSFEEMDRNRDGILTRFEYEDATR